VASVEDLEMLDLSGIVAGNVKQCSHFGKVCQFLKRLVTNDLATQLLGIYSGRNECPHKRDIGGKAGIHVCI
jgi:hypothetical protein